MISEESSIIDDAFEKEIGIDMDSAIELLAKGGLSADYLKKIMSDVKNVIINEVDRRNVPYEYRFLLINVILCRMFKTTVAFHKAYMKTTTYMFEQLVKEQLKKEDLDREIVDAILEIKNNNQN